MDYGSVESIWRYPVKSLLGERLDSVDIDARGVLNDRAYAVMTAQGKLGSGKNSNRFRQLDGLFRLSAATDKNGVAITLPDGGVVTDRSPAVDTTLSQALGEDVRLIPERQLSHFDNSSIHILLSHSLVSLQASMPNVAIDERRFRPNIVLDMDPAVTDDDLVGQVIEIGAVKLEVTHKTKRCRMVTLAQSELPSRPLILRAMAKEYDLCFGVYARVLDAGALCVNDAVRIVAT